MKNLGSEVLRQEAKALQALAAKLDARAFNDAVRYLTVAGLVFVTGVGKSGHIARKIAATMTSLGTRALFLHPTEAAHGDLGMLTTGDALLMLTRSARAMELLPLIQHANLLGIKRVTISENDDGVSMGTNAFLKLPKVAEAWGHAPTSSTIMQMALGDALAVALAEERGFTEQDFRATHPGGALGAA